MGDCCIFHKSALSSKNNTIKRNPEELIWKRGKYHFLIFSNYNPPWQVIPATASLSASPPSSSSSSPVRLDGGTDLPLPRPLSLHLVDVEALTRFAKRGLTVLDRIHATHPQPGRQPLLIILASHFPPRLILWTERKETGQCTTTHKSEGTCWCQLAWTRNARRVFKYSIFLFDYFLIGCNNNESIN